MRELKRIREILKSWSGVVDILPAVGGAMEDLLYADVEEQEERAYTDEKVFDILWEDGFDVKKGRYRKVREVSRRERQVFRYFLDGSFRTYFLGTVIEGDRETPVNFAQVGACVIYRKDDGSVNRDRIEVRNYLILSRYRLSDEAWGNIESLCKEAGIELEDVEIPNSALGRFYSSEDLRNRSAGKVRYKMHELEADLALELVERIKDSGVWMVKDGSLMFNLILDGLCERCSDVVPIVGVAKNFRKDPIFSFGGGARRERVTIYRLLSELEEGARTMAFKALDGRIVFWYLRIRPQGKVDYPLMGVIKCELVSPNREPVNSELIDMVSGSLLSERNVTPYGRDRRWHSHLYPIYLAEQAIKSAFYSREVIQQLIRWR
jgi:hypothetical protein